jgi:DNA mismatch repair protein MutS
MESQIATADERLQSLEEEIFRDIIEKASKEVPALQEIAQAIGKIDLYAGLAEVALKNQYVRPELVDEPTLLIREGRHPVVESSIGGVLFRTMLSSRQDQTRSRSSPGPIWPESQRICGAWP